MMQLFDSPARTTNALVTLPHTAADTSPKLIKCGTIKHTPCGSHAEQRAEHAPTCSRCEPVCRFVPRRKLYMNLAIVLNMGLVLFVLACVLLPVPWATADAARVRARRGLPRTQPDTGAPRGAASEQRGDPVRMDPVRMPLTRLSQLQHRPRPAAEHHHQQLPVVNALQTGLEAPPKHTTRRYVAHALAQACRNNTIALELATIKHQSSSCVNRLPRSQLLVVVRQLNCIGHHTHSCRVWLCLTSPIRLYFHACCHACIPTLTVASMCRAGACCTQSMQHANTAGDAGYAALGSRGFGTYSTCMTTLSRG